MYSCITNKKITYFQAPLITGADSVAAHPKTKAPELPFEAIIGPNDILSINVASINPEATALFANWGQIAPGAGSGTGGSTNSTTGGSPLAGGYLVDAGGFIQLPVLGTIKVAGLTSRVAKDSISSRLQKFLELPVVSVRIVNFKLTLLGEVTRPGVYTISNEKISLPELIGMAGDMTIFGNRKNVLIIRKENDKTEYIPVDLTSRDVFTSPNYYLHHDDLVYVETGKGQGRIASGDNIYRILPIALSALNVSALLLYYLRK